MGSIVNPLILSPLFLLLCYRLPSATVSASQRNIETQFPALPSPAFLVPPPSFKSAPPPPPSPSSRVVTEAVIATAAVSFALCGLIFFVFQCATRRSRRRDETVVVRPKNSFRVQQPWSRSKAPLAPGSVFVDEDGLDAVCWREFDQKTCSRCSKEFYSTGPREEELEDMKIVSLQRINARRIEEKPLLHAGFVSFLSQNIGDRRPSSLRSRHQSAPLPVNEQHPPLPLPLPPPDRPLPPLPGRSISSTSLRRPMPQSAVLPAALSPYASSARAPSPPPSQSSLSSLPPATESNTLPPPPTMRHPNTAAPAPPPPPLPEISAKPPQSPPSQSINKHIPVPVAPPPPPGGSRQGGASSSSSSRTRPAPAGSVEAGGPKRLKPLHWEKVNPTNVDHSMVWERIKSGSFRVDEGIMVALFGARVDNKTTNGFGDSSASSSASSARAGASQICLLDPRRSQNVSIVLRSLTVSRQDILDGILDGYGISSDALERLTDIALAKEEEDLIRGYSGDPSKLAHAESFLFDILRAAPAAPFARLDALLFQANFKPEVVHHAQSLRTLEQACGELRYPTRRPFFKLLEAVLKAGNRMNAGTMRGNAQAFNLSALLKLSDVKSTDGSTTLLHFVVEEVVRAEGKRLVVSRNYNLRRSNSGKTIERTTSRRGRDEREMEYTMLGLPVVGGLSEEFSNLKKAAAIDYDVLIATWRMLQERLAEIRRLLETCGHGGFAREMKNFVERAENDLKKLKEEQVRVLEMVKRTTKYYHAGASNDRGGNPLQLFMVVDEFLDMVDRACMDITRNIQKKKQQPPPGNASETGRREVARFPNLPPHFLSDYSRSDSSSSDDD